MFVVDDGGTDSTAELVAELARELPQPVRYVYQPNRGAYGARNTGLDLVNGRYIAFFDSDDLWLPHHLLHGVAALDANSDVDWVFGGSCIVNMVTGAVVTPNTFYRRGRPRAFMRLRARLSGQLRVIDDPAAIECSIVDGFCSGLQCSVFRRQMFQAYRFEAISRNEAEDQLLLVHALTAGRRVAFLDDVHLIYRVHDDNSSAAGISDATDKRVHVFRMLIAGLEKLRTQVPLTSRQGRALRHRIAQEYFWHLGYALFWRNERRPEALAAFHQALRYWPRDWKLWKTYLVARLRMALTRRSGSASPARG